MVKPKPKEKSSKKSGKQSRSSNSEDVVQNKREERAERSRLKKQREREAQGVHRTADEDKMFVEQMKKIGCRIKFITGDGNCLFRSIADQLDGKPHEHASVRRGIMDYVEKHREVFEPYMEDDEPFDAYVRRMRRDGEWGGHQELFASSQLYKAHIIVHQFQAPRFEIHCKRSGGRILNVSYHGEQHYNSVRLLTDGDRGPAAPVRLTTPLGGGSPSQNDTKATKTTWCLQEEELLAQSFPCASAADIALALRAAGGKVEEAMELLVDSTHKKSERESDIDEKHQGKGYQGAASKQSAKERQSSQKHHLQQQGSGASRGSRGGSGSSSVFALGFGAGSLERGEPNEKRPSSSSGTGKKSPHPQAAEEGGKIPRGADCPCGSGAKYKKCCRKKDAAKGKSSPGSIKDGQGSSGDPVRGRELEDEFGSLII
ncbi:unnamed protein product [Discosporangium mesarthrocarpum]